MKPLEIKGARTRLGYTQRYVADQLDITENSYHKKESGKVRFTDKEKIRLARLLGLNLQQFNDFFYDGELPAGSIACTEQ